MKRKFSVMLTASLYIVSLYRMANAQGLLDWSTGGNTINGTEWFGATSTSDIDLQIRHNNNRAIQFWTNGIHHMTLSSPQGWLGIGGAPAAGLHTFNRNVIFDGSSTADIAYNGMAYQSAFFWISAKNALRFGDALNNTEQSLVYANVGTASFAAGTNCSAFGDYSFCFGHTSGTDGAGAFSIGKLNQTSGNFGVTLGCFNTNNGFQSHALGTNITVNADNSFTIGHGLAGNNLSNATANSLMVGMNSDVSTLFVSGGDGSLGSLGSVGIGNIITPTQRLDVNGNARFRFIPDNADNVLISGTTNADGDYTLSRIDLGSASDQYLANDGSWQIVPEGESTTANNGVSLNGTTVELGNAAGGSASQLTSVRHVPLNGFDICFTDPTAINGNFNRIGIGTADPGKGKLFVQRSESDTPIDAPRALYVVNDDLASNNSSSFGLTTECTGAGNFHNIGGSFSVSGGLSNTGIMVNSSGNGTQNTTGQLTTVLNTGTANSFGHRLSVNSASATGTLTNVGNFISITSHPSNTNVTNFGLQSVVSTAGTDFAVWGQRYLPGSDDGNTVAGPDYAGFFSGDLGGTGEFAYVSDRNLKKEIKPLDNALKTLKQLNPVTYEFRNEEFPQMQLPRGQRVGFIAQEVQQVFPQYIKSTVYPPLLDEEGNVAFESVEYLALNNTEFIALNTACIKEQQIQIEQQQHEMEELREMIAQIQEVGVGVQAGIDPIHYMHLKLDDPRRAELLQCVPNPNLGQCELAFFLPNDDLDYQLHIVTQSGVTLKRVGLTTRGETMLQIDAQSLTQGIYTIVLIADGIVVDSEQMVRQ